MRRDLPVLFLYLASGSEQEVRLTGDFRTRSFANPYWDLVGESMTRVGSIFYLRRTFESDARLDYRFVVNGKGKLDPLNPRTIVSGAGEGDASELVMPNHHIPEEIVVTARVPRGTLHVVQEPWATPKVTIYLPATTIGNTSPRHSTRLTGAPGSTTSSCPRFSTI